MCQQSAQALTYTRGTFFHVVSCKSVEGFVYNMRKEAWFVDRVKIFGPFNLWTTEEES